MKVHTDPHPQTHPHATTSTTTITTTTATTTTQQQHTTTTPNNKKQTNQTNTQAHAIHLYNPKLRRKMKRAQSLRFNPSGA